MTAIDVAQGVTVIVFIAGATVPAWFPAVASASRQCRMWAAWRRLRPLWVLLLKAVPDVQLPAQPGMRLGASYRLHRRVIEIRDAELVLRPFRDSQAARDAADAARSAGLHHHEHDAVIEAVLIVTALDVRRGGAKPRSGGSRAASAVSEPLNDLESETHRLLLVSRAVRRSLIVRQAVAAAWNRSTGPSACMSAVRPMRSRAATGASR
jgi:hypothetical protein